MVEIDGSLGGGQLLRTAIALSVLTSQAVKINNIRKSRSRPGLRPQHMMGIKAAKELCNAKVSGLSESSMEVEFTPGKLKAENKRIDIGTAGSISLLLQTLIPLMVFAKDKAELEIIGGTETKWSPTIQYTKYVKFPLLEKMGASLNLEILKHGYYPKGGGKIVVKSEPVKKLRPIVCLERGKIEKIFIESVTGNIGRDVAERQGKSALTSLHLKYPKTEISLNYKNVNALSAGTSVTCFSVCQNSILGSSSLGQLGVKAEVVGSSAAEELLKSTGSSVAFDKYMADQILLYLALANGESRITIEKITDHCLTNIHVIEKMIPVKFEIKEREDKSGEIRVKGIGFSWEQEEL